MATFYQQKYGWQYANLKRKKRSSKDKYRLTKKQVHQNSSPNSKRVSSDPKQNFFLFDQRRWPSYLKYLKHGKASKVNKKTLKKSSRQKRHTNRKSQFDHHTKEAVDDTSPLEQHSKRDTRGKSPHPREKRSEPEDSEAFKFMESFYALYSQKRREERIAVGHNLDVMMMACTFKGQPCTKE